MSIQLPDDKHRFRCGRCGNLTRFDVVKSQSTREFWHLTMGGDVVVETTEVTSESISTITCRWCSATDEIEHVLRPDAGGPADEPASAH